MIKKFFIIGLLSFIILGCEKTNNDALWGAWNLGKITSDKYASTLTLYGKYYKVNDSYLVISIRNDYEGVIHDLSESLYITEIDGKYPVYNLKVKASYMGLENSVQIEKWHHGKIIVHCIDKNTIWFENALSSELNNLLKVRHFNLKFGSDKIFYRAEQIDKPLPVDPNVLQ